MDVDYRLRPRGLLLSGKPGTGKTMGAKRIASRLNVPLMRLDLGIVMSKYVGESEANLATALARVEEAQPCVMLIDEVEKLFHGEDESGVTQNLLAGLLWWMQEHRAAVLTIMTTNDMKKLPPELIRPGRIDCQIETKGIAQKDWAAFIRKQVEELGYNPEYVVTFVEPGRGMTQAILAKIVIESVRRYELTNAK
jgi:SpoVK/Ycf46/Vps4 family AAA+-type ATPase